MSKLIYVAPRVLGILTILFISIFALDVFGHDDPWLDVLIGFAMHLVPGTILTIALAIAWRFERAGGILLFLIGLTPTFLMRGPILSYMIIGGPIIATSLLFLLSYWWRIRQSDN